MHGSIGSNQPGAINSGSLGYVQPGAYRSGSLGLPPQPGAYRSGSLGLPPQPGALRSGSLGFTQYGARNSGSLGCGCGPKAVSGLGTLVRQGTLRGLGLGRALGGMSIDLDFLVGAGVVGAGIYMLMQKQGGC